MSDHARFSPSAAHRWMPCPGSIAACRDIPNPSSVYADEGSAAHIVAARALTYHKPASFFKGEEIQVGERVFIVGDDMALYVQVYLDEVAARVGAYHTVLCEQKIEFSQAIGQPEQFGTSDAIIIHADGKTVEIGDLKYGQGLRVDAEENEQMLTYAVGVLETFEPLLTDVEKVVLFVVQPRLDHVSNWETTVERVRKHAAEIKAAALLATQGLLELDVSGTIPAELFHPGEDACRFCPAKSTCPALQASVAKAVFDDFQALDDPASLAVKPAPAVPAGHRLGALFGSLELIESWCRSVRAEVERMVLAGMEVIGPDGQRMKLVEGKRGNRKWTDPKDAEALLAGFLPPERLYHPREIISPSEAAKILDKKATAETWATVQEFITQAPGKPKVTLGSDPAPPYRPEADAHEFEALE